MAGHMLRTPLTAEQESALAHTPAGELLRLPFADPEALGQGAYGLAKYGNRLRVQAASAAWGARGARINSVSPGVIATPMGQQELDGVSGRTMRAMVAASGTGRLGTPEDIAEAAAFLLGPGASFITGNDLLVDGGVVAALRSGHLTPAGCLSHPPSPAAWLRPPGGAAGTAQAPSGVRPAKRGRAQPRSGIP